MTALPDTALSVPSSNFESHKFKQIDEHTLRIQPTIGSLAFCLLFFLIGCGMVLFWIASAFSSFDGANSVILLLVGLLFTGFGLALYRKSNEQLIINRKTGAAFIRSWLPSVPLNTRSLFRHVLPTEIRAIQLVARVVSGNSTNRSKSGRQRGRKTTRSYTEFQVNICTTDDERSNALVTLKHDKAEKAGALMAQILDVQLVDQVDTEKTPDN